MEHKRKEEILNEFINTTETPTGLTSYFSALTLAGTAAVGGALYYYLNKASQKVVPLYDYKNQSREIEECVRISSQNKTNEVIPYYYDDVKTVYDVYVYGEKKSENGPCLGWKPSPNQPFNWMSYSQCLSTAQELGSAFIHFGEEPQTETIIGIFARNRPEWVLTDMACQSYSFVSVPLYDTLGQEAITFILIQTQMRTVVCDDSEKAIHLMNAGSNLKQIIIIDKINDDARSKASEKNIRLLTFQEAQDIGKSNLKSVQPPKPLDLATICYTSGTTGQPKGALITHENLVSISSSILQYICNKSINLDKKQRYLSYLPLAHMFERASHVTLMGLGASIAFYQGDIKKLVDDLKEVKPTIFCTVPRLLTRIYSKIKDNLEKSPAYKKQIFNWCFAQKEKELMRGVVRNNGIYDIAFKQIRESLGGAVQFIISGSAPIDPAILHFLRVVSGCYVLEGYGATETAGACAIQLPGETTVGSVGPPLLCSKFKLADVEEMNLIAKRDNKGEILVAGSNIFKGYFKDDEKTKAALTEDGWYRTGDIGTYDENGCLKIVDRVKNIFKLQQGEYIAPEKLENVYIRSKYVAQIFIHGSSLKSCLVAIVVPEEAVICEWALANNCEQDFAKLCKNKDLKKVILEDMVQLGKSCGLKGFEMTRDIYLHDELFSLENNMLTPTMKAKRNVLQKHFQNQIDEMYTVLE